MIFTSINIRPTAPTTGGGKSGFFSPGEAAHEKLYSAEYAPSWPGERGLVFPLSPLAHAPVGIPLSFSRLAHSAAVRSGHHHTTGAPKMPQSRDVLTTSASDSFRPAGFQAAN
jgi:hypothetical protein